MLSSYLIAAACVQLVAAEPSQNTSTPTAPVEIDQSRPIVEAVYSFRAARGLWPQRLTDLTPDFLPSAPAGKWEYRWDPEGESNLRCRITEGSGASPQLLVFVFGGDDEGWHIGRSGSFRDLPDTPPAGRRAIGSTTDLLAARLAEFDRRIGREPGESIHRRGQLTLLFRAKEYESAKRACIEWVRVEPLDWRPRWALLEVERIRLAGVLDEDAERKWAESKHTTLAHWRLFNHPRTNTGALQRLPGALDLPAAGSSEEWLVAEIALAEALDHALGQETFNRAVEVCDIWEANAAKSEGAILQDWYFLRGAARVALGDFKGASRDADKAIEAERAGRTSYQTESLRRAILAKDAKYRVKSVEHDEFWLLEVQ